MMPFFALLWMACTSTKGPSLDSGTGDPPVDSPGGADAGGPVIDPPEPDLPAPDPQEAGRCADGRDNDHDGLLDCEDEDCEADAACAAEVDCADGVDNDDDGATDCGDEDCWGGCPDLVVTVRGGRLHATRSRRDLDVSTWDGGCDDSHQSQTTAIHATARSVTGTVRVRSAEGAWATCAWSVAQARVGMRRAEGSRLPRDVVDLSYHSSWTTASGAVLSSTFTTSTCAEGTRTSWRTSSVSAPARTGFVVEAGCGLDSSGFVPSALVPERLETGARWRTQEGAGWYGGVPVMTYGYRTANSSGGVDFSSQITSFEIDPLISAEISD